MPNAFKAHGAVVAFGLLINLLFLVDLMEMLRPEITGRSGPHFR